MKKSEMEKLKYILLKEINEQKTNLETTISKNATESPEDTFEIKVEKSMKRSFFNGGIFKLEDFEKYVKKLSIKDLL